MGVLKNELDTKTDLGHTHGPNRVWARTFEIHINCDPHALRGAQKKVRATCARMRNLIFATPPVRERDCKKSYIFKWFFEGFQKYENFDAFFAHLKHSERLTFWNCKIGARQTLRSLLFREQRRLPLGRCLKSWNSHSYGRRTNFFLCSAPSVGMPLLPSDENPWARIAILMVTKSWNCKKMLLSRGFGASQFWKSRARKNCQNNAGFLIQNWRGKNDGGNFGARGEKRERR